MAPAPWRASMSGDHRGGAQQQPHAPGGGTAHPAMTELEAILTQHGVGRGGVGGVHSHQYHYVPPHESGRQEAYTGFGSRVAAATTSSSTLTGPPTTTVDYAMVSDKTSDSLAFSTSPPVPLEYHRGGNGGSGYRPKTAPGGRGELSPPTSMAAPSHLQQRPEVLPTSSYANQTAPPYRSFARPDQSFSSTSEPWGYRHQERSGASSSLLPPARPSQGESFRPTSAGYGHEPHSMEMPSPVAPTATTTSTEGAVQQLLKILAAGASQQQQQTDTVTAPPPAASSSAAPSCDYYRRDELSTTTLTGGNGGMPSATAAPPPPSSALLDLLAHLQQQQQQQQKQATEPSSRFGVPSPQQQQQQHRPFLQHQDPPPPLVEYAGRPSSVAPSQLDVALTARKLLTSLQHLDSGAVAAGSASLPTVQQACVPPAPLASGFESRALAPSLDQQLRSILSKLASTPSITPSTHGTTAGATTLPSFRESSMPPPPAAAHQPYQDPWQSPSRFSEGDYGHHVSDRSGGAAASARQGPPPSSPGSGYRSQLRSPPRGGRPSFASGFSNGPSEPPSGRSPLRRQETYERRSRSRGREGERAEWRERRLSFSPGGAHGSRRHPAGRGRWGQTRPGSSSSPPAPPSTLPRQRDEGREYYARSSPPRGRSPAAHGPRGRQSETNKPVVSAGRTRHTSPSRAFAPTGRQRSPPARRERASRTSRSPWRKSHGWDTRMKSRHALPPVSRFRDEPRQRNPDGKRPRSFDSRRQSVSADGANNKRVMERKDVELSLEEERLRSAEANYSSKTFETLSEDFFTASCIMDLKDYSNTEVARLDNMMTPLWVYSTLKTSQATMDSVTAFLQATHYTRFAERCTPGLLLTGLPNVNTTTLQRALTHHFRSQRIAVNRMVLPVFPFTGLSMGWGIVEPAYWRAALQLVTSPQFQWRGMCTKVLPLPCPQILQLNAGLALASQRLRGQVSLDVSDWSMEQFATFSRAVLVQAYKEFRKIADPAQATPLNSPVPFVVSTSNRRLQLCVPTLVPCLSDRLPNMHAQYQSTVGVYTDLAEVLCEKDLESSAVKAKKSEQQQGPPMLGQIIPPPFLSATRRALITAIPMEEHMPAPIATSNGSVPVHPQFCSQFDVSEQDGLEKDEGNEVAESDVVSRRTSSAERPALFDSKPQLGVPAEPPDEHRKIQPQVMSQQESQIEPQNGDRNEPQTNPQSQSSENLHTGSQGHPSSESHVAVSPRESQVTVSPRESQLSCHSEPQTSCQSESRAESQGNPQTDVKSIAVVQPQAHPQREANSELQCASQGLAKDLLHPEEQQKAMVVRIEDAQHIVSTSADTNVSQEVGRSPKQLGLNPSDAFTSSLDVVENTFVQKNEQHPLDASAVQPVDNEASDTQRLQESGPETENNERQISSEPNAVPADVVMENVAPPSDTDVMMEVGVDGDMDLSRSDEENDNFKKPQGGNVFFFSGNEAPWPTAFPTPILSPLGYTNGIPAPLGLPAVTPAPAPLRSAGTAVTSLSFPNFPLFRVDSDDVVVRPIGKEDEMGFSSLFSFGNHGILALKLLVQFFLNYKGTSATLF